MPASFHIRDDEQLVLTTLYGRLTNQDLADHQRWLCADSSFRPEFDQFVDTSGVTDVAIDGEGIRAIAKPQIFGKGSRRAILARSDTIYGMARMFQILRATGLEQVRVFRHADAAWTWLRERGRNRPPLHSPPTPTGQLQHVTRRARRTA